SFGCAHPRIVKGILIVIGELETGVNRHLGMSARVTGCGQLVGRACTASRIGCARRSPALVASTDPRHVVHVPCRSYPPMSTVLSTTVHFGSFVSCVAA